MQLRFWLRRFSQKASRFRETGDLRGLFVGCVTPHKIAVDGKPGRTRLGISAALLMGKAYGRRTEVEGWEWKDGSGSNGGDKGDG